MDPESIFRTDHSLPGCRSTTTTISPAHSVEYHESQWVGAVVVVLSGRMRLECWSGRGACFEAGAVLFLTGLDLRQITNPGLVPLMLRTIRRDDSA